MHGSSQFAIVSVRSLFTSVVLDFLSVSKGKRKKARSLSSVPSALSETELVGSSAVLGTGVGGTALEAGDGLGAGGGLGASEPGGGFQ